MSIARKLKWMRSISRLRYLYEELELVQMSSKECGALFQEHYDSFCTKRNIDIAALNEANQQKLKKIYNHSPKQSNQNHNIGDVQYTGSYELKLYDKNKEISESDETVEYVQKQDDGDVHSAFVKLFKKIAMILHPDKIDRNLPIDEVNRMIDLYKDANRALATRKYFILLEIAEQYSISIPKNYEQQTRWMKREIYKTESKIDIEKRTYNYLFSQAESEEEKDEVIRSFMAQLFGTYYQ